MHQDQLEYHVVDVFAERAFEGNQLAVVHRADGLSAEQMQTLATEFGYSETTFPTPLAPDRYRVRIFTPGGEVPFAGHPTLGTAWVLRRHGLVTADALTQECGAGEIGVRVSPQDGVPVQLSAAARDLAGPVDRDTCLGLLADLGLGAADLAGEAWVAGAGLSFVHLPVAATALDRAHASARPLVEYGESLTAHTRDPVEGINLHSVRATSDRGASAEVDARVFVPGLAVAEDAATGSAAAGLGLALVATGTLPEGGHYEITQGVVMGRPSRLHGEVDVENGRAVRCRVAGRVQPIAQGRIEVPGG